MNTEPDSLSSVNSSPLSFDGRRSALARRLRPSDGERLRRERHDHRHRARLWLLEHRREASRCAAGIASRDGVEKIAHRFAGTNADDRRDRGFVDRRRPPVKLDELVELDLELREIRAHRFLKQRHRALGDRRLRDRARRST